MEKEKYVIRVGNKGGAGGGSPYPPCGGNLPPYLPPSPPFVGRNGGGDSLSREPFPEIERE